MISDYTFTIIEEEKVPLAASFDTGVDIMPIVVAVVVMALVVALIAYTVWFLSHKSHIVALTGNTDKKALFNLFIHPRRLIQLEYETENIIANQYLA